LGHSNAKVFPQGSLLIGMYDTAALKMSVLDRDAAFNQAIAGVKPNDSIDLVFLLHAINSQKEKILNERRGTRQKNLSLAKIKDIHLRVPPIAHQRKIVALLENDALGCESLSEVIRSKIAALDELKQSLLHQAFSGNL
jgi:type I restriction enzyme S subunit